MRGFMYILSYLHFVNIIFKLSYSLFILNLATKEFYYLCNPYS